MPRDAINMQDLLSLHQNYRPNDYGSGGRITRDAGGFKNSDGGAHGGSAGPAVTLGPRADKPEPTGWNLGGDDRPGNSGGVEYDFDFAGSGGMTGSAIAAFEAIAAGSDVNALIGDRTCGTNGPVSVLDQFEGMSRAEVREFVSDWSRVDWREFRLEFQQEFDQPFHLRDWLFG